MEEWDSNMRVMRNEIFSMCGLLAEAEEELTAALTRTDEGVHHVTSMLGPARSKRAVVSSGGGETQETRKGAENLTREDYAQCHVGLERCHASLERSMTTCQNCILTLEDDFHSISEQVLPCLSTCGLLAGVVSVCRGYAFLVSCAGHPGPAR